MTYVEGQYKDGDTATRNTPVIIGGVAANNTVQTLLVNSDGSINTSSTSGTSLTPSAPTATTVGVSSAQAVAANSSRTGLVLTNTSANTISLGLAATAVLNSGITLTPNGGVWVMDGMTWVTGAINAIASAGSSNLAVQEFS